MKRNKFQAVAATLLPLLALAPAARAQDDPVYYNQSYTDADAPLVGTPVQSAPDYSPEQLDQMLAPVALYPDELVSQVLTASTYPLEVVEAYRWIQDPANANLHGDDLDDAVDQMPWAPSVKALTEFPAVLKIMNDNLQWTEQLGDAFLADQGAVMDSVQRLRHQAAAAGTLASTPQYTVSYDDSDIDIEPATPDVVYVPYYNPQYAYGSWAYSDYPPYYFEGYNYPDNGSLVATGIAFAVIAILWDLSRPDWHHHHINIDDHHYRHLNHDHAPAVSGTWEHDPDHRRGVPYRSENVRARYEGGSAAAPQHRVYRGFEAPENAQPAQPAAQPPVRQSLHVQTAPANAGIREEHPAGQRHGTYGSRNLPPAEATQAPQASSAPVLVPSPRPTSPPMFESISRGAEVRQQAERGLHSRATPSPQISAPSRGRPPQQMNPRLQERGPPGAPGCRDGQCPGLNAGHH